MNFSANPKFIEKVETLLDADNLLETFQSKGWDIMDYLQPGMTPSDVVDEIKHDLKWHALDQEIESGMER